MMPIIQLCRICGIDSNLIEINFKRDSEKLLTCANIKFDLCDKLPKYICRNCKQSLDISYKLRKQSEETEERLKLKLEVVCDEAVQYQSQVENKDQKEEKATIGPIEDVEEEEEEFIKITKEDRAAAVVKVDLENVRISNKFSPITIISNDSSSRTLEQRQEDESLHDSEAVNLITDSESESSSDHNYQDINCNSNGTSASGSISASTSASINASISASTSASASTSTRASTKASTDTRNVSQQITVNILDTIDTTNYRLHHVNSPQSNIKHLYECSICNKPFTTQKSITSHISAVHKELFRVFKCSTCNRSYRRRHNLMQHIRKVHTPPSPPTTTTASTIIQQHLCPLCNEEFQMMDLFKEHILKHFNDEASYKCLKCLQRFYTLEEWKAHDKSHEITKAASVEVSATDLVSSVNAATSGSSLPDKIRPTQPLYHCPYCNKMSESFEMHTNHMKMHNNDKQYPCKKCSRKFRTILSLLNHECNFQDATEEGKYVCNVCLCSFKEIHAFVNHKLEHGNTAPCVCKICFTSFIGEYELKLHMEQQHSSKYLDLQRLRRCQKQQEQQREQSQQQQGLKVDVKSSISLVNCATSLEVACESLTSDVKADMGEDEGCSINESKLFNDTSKTTKIIEENDLNSIIIESDSDNESEFISQGIKRENIEENSLLEAPETMLQKSITISLLDDDDDDDNNNDVGNNNDDGNSSVPIDYNFVRK